MRPILKINDIKDLQDARYCAAISIAMLGFRLLPADGGSSPAAVAEIMEWLSGPEAVGEWEFETPATINATAAAAKIARVSLPGDYPAALAAEIELPLLFRMELDAQLGALPAALDLAVKFPTALFELRWVGGGSAIPVDADLDAILPRSLIVAEAPDTIYALLRQRGIRPFGFTLGSFINESDGGIDYNACDDFATAYFEMELA